MKPWTRSCCGLIAPGVALTAALLLIPLSPGADLQGQSLRGSQASMDRQNAQARTHDFTYLRTAEDIRRFVELGHLIPVAGNGDLEVHQVSFPYARPELRVFLERLAAQYRSACGEKLVVTSLTRPITTQPANASSRSVHPTGMAVDIRRTTNLQCRRWLESTLLALEGARVLEVIYERYPPHYHVALFPQPYARYLARQTGNDRIIAQHLEGVEPFQVEWVTHRVARGETLVGISGRYGTAVPRIQAENRLSGHRIMVGQELRIPVYGPAAASRPAVRVAAAAEDVGDAGDAEAARDAGDAEASSPGAGQAASRASTQAADAGAAAENGSGNAAPGEARSHTVTRGESLWTIARRYGVTEVAIRAANDLTGTRIVPGQELTIPLDGEVPDRIRHQVRPGESLWVIARRHGTTVDAIIRTNGISQSQIHPGQVLEVPISR